MIAFSGRCHPRKFCYDFFLGCPVVGAVFRGVLERCLGQCFKRELAMPWQWSGGGLENLR